MLSRVAAFERLILFSFFFLQVATCSGVQQADTVTF